MGLVDLHRSRVNPGYSESNVERHILPRMLITSNGLADWHDALDGISMGSPEQVFDFAIWVVCVCVNFIFRLLIRNTYITKVIFLW